MTTVRALVQRVESASVRDRSGAGGEVVGAVGRGFLVYLGITHDDGPAQVAKLASKLWSLRVFVDDAGAMNLSLSDLDARGDDVALLVVSQFTLYGDTRKGRRPSFVAAARPEHAEPLVDALVEELRSLGAVVATGSFGADMAVESVNDGPINLLVEV